MGEAETVLTAEGEGLNLEMGMESGMGRRSRAGTAILYVFFLGVLLTAKIGLYSRRGGCHDEKVAAWLSSGFTGHVVTAVYQDLG